MSRAAIRTQAREAHGRRLSSFGLFVAAFLSLLAGAVAVGFAQFTSGSWLPWLSISLSVLAVACTAASLVVRSG